MTSKTYKSVYNEIEELDIPTKHYIFTIFLSALVSLLLVAGPIVFCVNMLIFTNYLVLFAFLIAVCIIIFVFLTDYFYLHTLAQKKVTGLYHIWAIDTAVAAAVVLFIFMILTMIGVI